MDIAKSIKELRESTGMSRKEFSEHTGILVRTLEDWEAGRRTPPEYIPRLLTYQIRFEWVFAARKKVNCKRSVSVIQDVDGNNIVIINDIRFKGKRSIDWKDVREYLKTYVGEFYMIAATNDLVYIGSDLPKEYSGSNYTNSLKGANAKAKANAATGIPEMIEISVGKHFRENREKKHKRDAKNGWYRYDSRFALPVYGDKGELERYNIFHASMLVRHSNDGKLYLYDVIDIKKETSNSLGE
jgi:DNA-binding XRE family transcriptional regulator